MRIGVKNITVEYRDLENVELPTDIPFELIVNLNNSKYEFYMHIKKNCDKFID